MAEPLRQRAEPIISHDRFISKQAAPKTPAYQAFLILRFAFVVAPIVAGLDKFFHVLTNWDLYLSPLVPQLTGIGAHSFMQVAGVIEIIAGIGVALRPKLFSYIVAVWMAGIIVNLLTTGQYFDIALRDLGLMLAAVSLGRLSMEYA